MNRILISRFLLLPFLLFSAGEASAQRPHRAAVRSAAPQEREDEQVLRNMESAVFELVNAHRRKLGLPLLQADSVLSTLALQHSTNMAGGKVAFSHKGFEARSAVYQKAVGVRVSGMAENVAYNSEDAEDVVADWLNSSGHRRNIEGSFNRLGVGIARNAEGNLYFTQIFANR